MPANLTGEALAAKLAYEEASTLEERIEKLEKFLSLIPKHKSSEKMVAHYRHRFALLRQELEERRAKRRVATGGPSFSLPKEGAGQVVLIGLTGSGKSALLNRLTAAKAKVGTHEFTTQLPEPGILKFGGTDIQIIEMPALFPGAEDSTLGRQILGGTRNADLVALVIDLSKPPIPQMEFLIGLLERARIKLNKQPPPIRFTKTGSGGVHMVGQNHFRGDPESVRQLLMMRRIHNCAIQFRGPSTFDDFIEVLDSSTRYAPAIVIATKGDAPDSSKHFEELNERYRERFKVYAVSVDKDKGVGEVATGMFAALGVIRVYTRKATGETADKPLIVRKDATVEDLAKRLHSDFLRGFRHAVVFRQARLMKRKTVGLTFRLEDQDIVQIFTK